MPKTAITSHEFAPEIAQEENERFFWSFLKHTKDGSFILSSASASLSLDSNGDFVPRKRHDKRICRKHYE
jgi:hypothetical protein